MPAKNSAEPSNRSPSQRAAGWCEAAGWGGEIPSARPIGPFALAEAVSLP